jgi:hypothetical protein
MHSYNHIDSPGLSGLVLELVANVVEINGRGVLLLGTGKSSSSVLLTLLYQDTFIVADDWCNAIKINRIWGPSIRRYQKIQYPARPPEESYELFEKHELSEVLATAWKFTNGEIANTLGQYFRQIPTLSLDLEQLGIFPAREDYPETVATKKAQSLREIRLTSHFIDTIAQRVAHKAWVRIDAILFLVDGLIKADYIKDFFEAYQNQLQETFGKRVKDCYQYLSQTLFDKSAGSPRQRTIYLEKDPEKQQWLATFGWLSDTRGHDWRHLLQNTEVPLYFAFYYDNFLEKVRAIHDCIEPPYRIYDQREISLKYIDEEY